MKPREARAKLARQTVEVLEQGGYRPPDERWVAIGEWLESARRGTQVFTPEGLAALVEELAPAEGRPGTIRVENASARKPGGGFLKGAQAQEESLARASGLYACLREADAYYRANRCCGTALYTDHMIHSPGVPVFRDDDGIFLVEPYRVSMVTAPAVNRSALREREPALVPEAPAVMRWRMTKLLILARHRGHRRLVLGAWGCGVFGHRPEHVVEDFRALLVDDERFAGAFETVVFAVLDSGHGQQTFEAFWRCFESR